MKLIRDKWSQERSAHIKVALAQLFASIIDHYDVCVLAAQKPRRSRSGRPGSAHVCILAWTDAQEPSVERTIGLALASFRDVPQDQAVMCFTGLPETAAPPIEDVEKLGGEAMDVLLDWPTSIMGVGRNGAWWFAYHVGVGGDPLSGSKVWAGQLRELWERKDDMRDQRRKEMH